MRLVIDGQRLTARRTGVGRCLESLLAEWSEHGWPLDQTLLVLRDRSGLNAIPRPSEIEIVVVGERQPGMVWEMVSLRRHLGRRDVLLAPANLVPLNWFGRTVLILYDALPWSVPDRRAQIRFGWRYRLAARRATRVVFLPTPARTRSAAFMGSTRPACRSPTRVPTPAFNPIRRLGRDSTREDKGGGGRSPLLPLRGQALPRRHVPEIVAAFRSHLRVWPEHRLVFVGPAGGTPLPDPDDRIIDGGHVDETILHGLVATALAVVYPSDWEGFGLPVVEAMAAGTPVITSRNSALAESGGSAAYDLEQPSPNAIAEAMHRLAGDSELRTTLIARGLEHVRQFSRRAFADAVKAEIQRVAAVPMRPS
ncbi:MAG: glycosyltransferase family 1 protein [Isosphaeraceae bacterium]